MNFSEMKSELVFIQPDVHDLSPKEYMQGELEAYEISRNTNLGSDLERISCCANSTVLLTNNGFESCLCDSTPSSNISSNHSSEKNILQYRNSTENNLEIERMLADYDKRKKELDILNSVEPSKRFSSSDSEIIDLNSENTIHIERVNDNFKQMLSEYDSKRKENGLRELKTLKKKRENMKMRYLINKCGKIKEKNENSTEDTDLKKLSKKNSMDNAHSVSYLEELRANWSKLQAQSSSSFASDISLDDSDRKRRVSVMVDKLLLDIYGIRRRSSAFSEQHESTDSSNNTITLSVYPCKIMGSSASHLWTPKWMQTMRTKLTLKSLNDLRKMKESLRNRITQNGGQLVRQLKKRDTLVYQRDSRCNMITAFLQAKSEKRSEDTKMQFTVKPNPGENGFSQWQSAMVMVARMQGGVPSQFRKNLWLTLASRHIESRNINWPEVEKICFNDCSNPDDEDLGVQIVKDLHRTGCSLFCGTSGLQNQGLLKRVLLAYARWNKRIGYCQGFNMIAALIIEVMDKSEIESLKVMIYLIEGILPHSYFTDNLRGLSVDMAVFRDILALKLPQLSSHLLQLQTEMKDSDVSYEPPLTNVFTMQWFLTLFSNCLPNFVVLRIWDLVFLEGNTILLKTALVVWQILMDKIIEVKSADEYYTVMGVMSRQMLQVGLTDVNNFIKMVTETEMTEVTELRERYTYNITPWAQVAGHGLKIFYSEDDSDESDDEGNADLLSRIFSEKFMKGLSSLGSMSNDKTVLDIQMLKKQYSKIKERQRQARVIFTSARNSENFIGSLMNPPSGEVMNHLLLGKLSNNGKSVKSAPDFFEVKNASESYKSGLDKSNSSSTLTSLCDSEPDNLDTSEEESISCSSEDCCCSSSEGEHSESDVDNDDYNAEKRLECDGIAVEHHHVPNKIESDGINDGENDGRKHLPCDGNNVEHHHAPYEMVSNGMNDGKSNGKHRKYEEIKVEHHHAPNKIVSNAMNDGELNGGNHHECEEIEVGLLNERDGVHNGGYIRKCEGIKQEPSPVVRMN